MSLSWYWRLLVWDFTAWCNLSPYGFLAYGCSGFLVLLLVWIGMLVGPGDVGPTRGLDPTEDGSSLLETGSQAGTV